MILDFYKEVLHLILFRFYKLNLKWSSFLNPVIIEKFEIDLITL